MAGRYAGAAFWSFLAAAVSQTSNLLVSVAVARLLGKEEFGAYGMVQTTLLLFGTLAGLGLGIAATKLVAECRDSDRARAGRIIGLSSVFTWITGAAAGLVLAAAAPFLSAEILGSARFTPQLRWGAVLLFLTAMNGAQTGILAGFEAFREIVVANAGKLALVPAIVWAIMRSPRIETAIAGLSAAAGAGCLINFLAIRRRCAQDGIRIGHTADLRDWRLLFSHSLPVVLSSLMVGPVNWACNALLLRQPDGYAQLGIFTAASQWRTIVTFVPGVLAQASLPMLANLRSISVGRFRQVFHWSLALTVVSAAGIAVPVCAAAPRIMGIYGADFRSGWAVLALCAGVGSLTAVNTALGTLLTSAGEVWPCFGFNALWALSVLVLAWQFVPAHGAAGLATAFLLAYGAQTAWQGLYGWLVVRRVARSAA